MVPEVEETESLKAATLEASEGFSKALLMVAMIFSLSCCNFCACSRRICRLWGDSSTRARSWRYCESCATSEAASVALSAQKSELRSI